MAQVGNSRFCHRRFRMASYGFVTFGFTVVLGCRVSRTAGLWHQAHFKEKVPTSWTGRKKFSSRRPAVRMRTQPRKPYSLLEKPSESTVVSDKWPCPMRNNNPRTAYRTPEAAGPESSDKRKPPGRRKSTPAQPAIRCTSRPRIENMLKYQLKLNCFQGVGFQ